MLPGRKVRFVLAAIVLAFAAAEIASRIAGVPVEKTYFKNVADPAWGEDPELFWVPEGAFEAPYRAARDHDDGPLIYTFGGSIVRGFGVDVPNNHAPNPRRRSSRTDPSNRQTGNSTPSRIQEPNDIVASLSHWKFMPK